MDLFQNSKIKGFESQFFKGNLEAKNKFFWLCELQKWLREVHKIHLTVIHRNDFKTNEESYDYLLESKKVVYRNYSTWEEALEIGLVEALNMIPSKV